MRSVDEIIEDWKAEYGTLSYGKTGNFYRYIEYKSKKNLLLNLAQTLIDEGYGKEDLSSERNINKIAASCEAPDGASNRSKSKILKSIAITKKEWGCVLLEFFRGPVSSYKPEIRNKEIVLQDTPNLQEIKKKALEINPSDRIKIDTSDVSDNPLDLDFLKELGVDETFVTGENE